MAPAEVTADYYAVLEIPTTATLEVIKRSYRRLALLRHPDRNPHSLNSTAVFQLLQNAHETLSCPTARHLYDLQHPAIKARNADAHRRATAAQAAHERTTALAATLRTLHTELKRHDDRLFECNRALHKLEADVKRLRELDAEEERKERARNSWWSYLSAPLYGGRQAESAQEKLGRETERLQRGASRRIKESEVAKREKEVEGLLSRIDQVKQKIEAEKTRVAEEEEEEEAVVERARRARMQEEERERQKKEWMEILRAEAVRKQREREERERQQKEAAEHLRNLGRELRERQEREEATRVRMRGEHLQWAEAARQRARETGVGAQPHQGRQSGGMNRKSVCTHQKFWVKVEGRQLCSECDIVQHRFGFKCPGCSKVACASCRKKLRGEAERPFRGRARFETGGCDHDEDFDFSSY